MSGLVRVGQGEALPNHDSDGVMGGGRHRDNEGAAGRRRIGLLRGAGTIGLFAAPDRALVDNPTDRALVDNPTDLIPIGVAIIAPEAFGHAKRE